MKPTEQRVGIEMAYLEEEEVEEKPDGTLGLSSLTGMLGRKPKKAFKWKSTRPPIVDPHKEAEAEIAAMIERGRAPQPKPTVKPDPRQGPTYKPLDLAEVEEIMATEDTIAKGAEKLGMTTSQLSQRRYRDKAVDEAVERGRARHWASTDEDEDPEPDQPPEERTAKTDEIITNPITSNGHNIDNVSNVGIADNAPIAEIFVAPETPKEAMAKPEKIIPRIIPSNGNDLSAQLLNAIAEKEDTIAFLEEDIAALKRVVEILRIGL